jgi:hypothetical protein
VTPKRMIRLVVVSGDQPENKLFDQSIAVPDSLPDLDVVAMANMALRTCERHLNLASSLEEMKAEG